MAILFDLENCKINFIQSSSYITQKQLNLFCTTREELIDIDESKIISFKENIDLKIEFCAPEDAKLFMDGLDIIAFNNDINNVDFDEEWQENFIRPQEKMYTLFAQGEYPLMPGYYELRLVLDNTIYYSKVKIEPTLLAISDWEIIRDDLDAYLDGLAEEFVNKKIGIDISGEKKLTGESQFLRQFIVLKKYSLKLITLLEDFNIKVNCKIIKDHELVLKNRIKHVDEKTIRYKQQHQGYEDKSYVPIKKISYDLPENRYLKQTLIIIKRILRRVEQVSDAYLEIISDEICEMQMFKKRPSLINVKEKSMELIQNNIKICRRLSCSIEKVEQLHWYNEINIIGVSPIILPPQKLLDFRYNWLHKIRMDLKKNNFEITKDVEYTFQYKRTDKLYEIWGFLKVHEIIKNDMEFEPISGWIYDSKYISNMMIIPVLLPETTITYKKNDVILQLVYDSKIPSNSKETEMKRMPMYTSNKHNRPDARIDIYKNSYYIGSIIIDFKYRRPKSFWSEGLDPKNYLDTMNQLIAYGDNCRSIFLYGGKHKNIRPIKEVWAIYPMKSDREKDKERYFEDRNLRLLSVYPNKPNMLLRIIKEKLHETIEESLDYMIN